MNELALFAGAGGGILGGHLLGWRTVCAVEWEQYPASVLCARQNDGLLPPFPIWDDVQTFDGKPWRGIVDVVSGGFPCQDISAAGKGAGIDGERSGMWGEMARIIHEVRPRYVFVENSPMLTSRGLGRVLGDLASMGFDARWGVLGAADVGANHQRDRIWIVGKVGNANNNGQTSTKVGTSIAEGGDICKTWTEQTSESTRPSEQYAELADTKELFSNGCNDNAKISMEQKAQSESRNDCWEKNVAHTSFTRCQRPDWSASRGQEKNPKLSMESKQLAVTESKGLERWNNGRDIKSHESRLGQIGWSVERNWLFEPNVGRVADGVAARVDRLKAIGNGQVPLCAATAWRILSQ
jgi:DNA (cytosine-5)-methyltransferase 1